MEPPITIRALHDSGPGNLPPTRVVIHATAPNIGYPRASEAGKAASSARYFTSGQTIGSAHYVVDVAGEEHCVPDAITAHHAPPNPHSLGIEIAAEGGDYPRSYTREQWLSPLVWPAVLRAAERAAELCARFKIPAVKLSVADLRAGKHGICGHADVSAAWGQSSHSDPGPDFPWLEFLAAVGSSASTPPARTKDDDTVSPIPLTFYNDSWQPDPAGLNFRGSFTAEAGANSTVISRVWVRWVAYWGSASWRVVAWDATRPLGEPKDYSLDHWELPPGVRGGTVEGRREHPGVVPAASLLVLPK